MAVAVRYMGYRTALLLVVANMVGTGVFTTLGLQAVEIPNGFALLALWLFGGLIALFGALSYAELAAALPRSGGEYHFLTRIYHPVLGQLAGWVSVTVGFAAPVALAAMALGRYAATFLPVDATWTAVVTLLAVTGFHAFDVRLGQGFQVLSTLLKLLVLVLFCVLGLAAGSIEGTAPLTPTDATLNSALEPAFAVALIYVSYAYSGWNAAAYVVNEVEDPQRTVPRALIHGTLLVMLLYLLLNLVFLRTVPLDQLQGTVEVGVLSARAIFGPQGGVLISALLCLLLLSTVSGMILAGPRIFQVIGEDTPALRFLAALTPRGAPARAVVLQQAIALAFIATNSFEGVLTFAGFTLTLFAMLTVLGVLVLRYREPNLARPFRVPAYPWPPLIFTLVSVLTLIFVLQERPLAAYAGIGIVIVGLLLSLTYRSTKPPDSKTP